MNAAAELQKPYVVGNDATGCLGCMTEPRWKMLADQLHEKGVRRGDTARLFQPLSHFGLGQMKNEVIRPQARDIDVRVEAFERIVEVSERPVSRRSLHAAERQVIGEAFHGSRSAYLAAIKAAHANLGLARAVLADELRRARLEQPRYAPKPTGAEVATFYSAYPDLLVRRVRVSPVPPWLAARTGFAIAESAPARTVCPTSIQHPIRGSILFTAFNTSSGECHNLSSGP